MRVKFKDHIDECMRVTYQKGSSILVFESENENITVNFSEENYAKEALNKLLVDGYLDLSYRSYNHLIRW